MTTTFTFEAAAFAAWLRARVESMESGMTATEFLASQASVSEAAAADMLRGDLSSVSDRDLSRAGLLFGLEIGGAGDLAAAYGAGHLDVVRSVRPRSRAKADAVLSDFKRRLRTLRHERTAR